MWCCTLNQTFISSMIFLPPADLEHKALAMMLHVAPEFFRFTVEEDTVKIYLTLDSLVNMERKSDLTWQLVIDDVWSPYR